MTAADRIDAALDRIAAVWQGLAAEATAPREHTTQPAAEMPAHVVTRGQVLDLLRPFDDHPETVTFVDMGIKVTNVVRRHPTNPALTAPVLAALGLDPKRVVGLIIEPTRITVTEYDLDDGVPKVGYDNEYATVTTTIGIQ